MKRVPISPAKVVFGPDGTPRSSVYEDVYHARAGAWGQARTVFLQGNGLPQRWRGRDRFVILETGFGFGLNFLATWHAWAQDRQAQGQLWFISIERHPVPLDDARQALSLCEGTELQDKAQALLAMWPAASPDGFRARFANDRVVLQVLQADVGAALRDWPLQADAVYLDGFSPRLNPEMWGPPVFKALARRLAPGCTAATWSAARAVRQGLEQAGFAVERRAGFADKRHCLQARLVRTPPTVPDAARITRGAIKQPVVIIGAGLAGAACAQALSAAGVPSLVLDRATEPAQGASGNPAGLFHGVLHPQDGAHARLLRAAAWMAHRRYAPLIESGHIPGQARGLVRTVPGGRADHMQALAQALGLPAEFVQVLCPEQWGALLGLQQVPDHPAWFYPGGGWIDPGAWVREALTQPGVRFRGDTQVARLQRHAEQWVVMDEHGRVLVTAQQVVLCAAADVRALLPRCVTVEWAAHRQRGQVSRLKPEALPHPGPRGPVTGRGYALTLPGGDLLCGATSARDDDDAGVRHADHEQNLQRLQSLLGWSLQAPPTSPMVEGRVGWRFHTADRLPIVGPVPALEAAPVRGASLRLRDQAHEPGLYVATALGSRGITWAPLVGEVIASWITGQPPPLPTALLEALDPRRFRVKRARVEARVSAASPPLSEPR
jgi:tRNA 5-methylaminomethyl-2-thiouridine biosynthesis bifunctional protein